MFFHKFAVIKYMFYCYFKCMSGIPYPKEFLSHVGVHTSSTFCLLVQRITRQSNEFNNEFQDTFTLIHVSPAEAKFRYIFTYHCKTGTVCVNLLRLIYVDNINTKL